MERRDKDECASGSTLSNLFDYDACAHDESMDINSKALFEEHLVDSKITGLCLEFIKLGAPLACSRLPYRVGH